MLFFVAFKNILRNPRRSVVTLLTVAMGTFALFLFDGFNNGIMNQYRENTIHSRYGHGQLNTEGYRDQIFEKPWKHWIQDYEKVAKSLESIPEVKKIFPRVSFSSLLTNGDLTVSGLGLGVDGSQESDFFHTLNVIEGENLYETEDAILLGKGLARSLGVKPGDTITVLGNTVHGSINGLDLTVKGIFHTGAKNVDDTLFRIQLSQAHTLLDTEKVETVAIGLGSYEQWTRFVEQTDDLLPKIEATSFAVLDKVYYQHAVDWLGQQFYVIQFIIIFIITLGIINTVSFTVLERTQEIGNLRANGESKFEVILLLLTEGSIIGLIGGVLGVLIGYILNAALLGEGILMPPAPGITRQYNVMIELQSSMALLATVIGCTTAILGSFIASLKVTKISIADALRTY